MNQKLYKEFERHFYMKIIVTIILTNSYAMSLLSFFLSFRRNQTHFLQVAGLVARNISVLGL